MRHITIPHLRVMKQEKKKITVLTVYDASFAETASSAGVDILLVGDSLGMVFMGEENTLKVTIEQIAYHTQAVVAGNFHSLVMSDLPFMSFYSPDVAIEHCTTLMRAGAQMIKIEGNAWLAQTIQFLTQRGVPVCGHIGLTPQFVHMLGGFKIQGRNKEKAQELLDIAILFEQAGAQLLVLECVPYSLAKEISESVTIPTIGIGAGPYCDGQVLVLHDILGIPNRKQKKFVKNYLINNPSSITAAIEEYVKEVREHQFPTLDHSFE